MSDKPKRKHWRVTASYIKLPVNKREREILEVLEGMGMPLEEAARQMLNARRKAGAA